MTVFLHGKFPEGMRQYVRAPRGVPKSILPKLFELGSCVYGHPLTNIQWDKTFRQTLNKMGFESIQSAVSFFVKEKTTDTDKVLSASNTDDSLFALRYESKMKQVIIDNLNAKGYQITVEDPVINYLGMVLTRNRQNSTIEITMPKFMSTMEKKYPLPPDITEYPTSPAHYTKYFSKEDLQNRKIVLDEGGKKKFQEILGDLLWVIMHIKPNVKFIHNMLSRKVSPALNLYDFKQALQSMHYCIGTKYIPRIIGDQHGVIVTGTVDSSHASHDDLKGHSAYSLHMGGGGAFQFETKKHTVHAASSAESEVLGDAIVDKEIKWARNFCEEMGYDQKDICPNGTPLGQDNMSAMKILASDTQTGKTKHMDLRIKIQRESRKNKIVQDFHLPSEHMPSDIGTKYVAPGLFERLSKYVLGTIHVPFFKRFFKSNGTN